jgi:hypothetical protein
MHSLKCTSQNFVGGRQESVNYGALRSNSLFNQIQVVMKQSLEVWVLAGL